MEKTAQKYSDITTAQIAKWKQTKGALTEESIPLTDDPNSAVAKFVVCKPTRNVLSAIVEYGKKDDVDTVNKLLITNCVLGGDMQHLEDTKIYLSMLEVLGKLLQPRPAKSKKL